MDQTTNSTDLPAGSLEKIPEPVNQGVSRKLLLPPISPKLLKQVLSVVGVLLIVGSIGTAYYFYSQYQNTQKLLKNPSQASNAQVQSVVKKVANLMELPTNETPQIATVVDKTKLADQPFFARSENGDTVLLYTKNREAILYRSKINKIIEVAPLNSTNPPANSPAKEQGHVAGATTKQATATPSAKPVVTKAPQK
jgi:hypothetical protein